MSARVFAACCAALFLAACADRPFGPGEDPVTERVAPPFAESHGMQHFRITPVALDFGQVPVGTTAAEQFVLVTNVGAGSAVMEGTGGAAAGFGGVQNCQGTTLAEGASCVMAYSFAPTDVGMVEATATGTWNDQPFTISMRGEGVPDDRFSITPTSLNFGQTGVGASSAPQAVTVTNLGPGPIVMSGTGGAAGVFGGVQSCQGATLAEGESCEMTYVFTPTSAGMAHETATGTWNGQPFSVDLRGEGMQSQRFEIRATSLDFGEVPVGGFSLMEIVDVKNLGPGPVVMNGAVGATSAFMTAEGCQGVMLAEGASCQMYFAFMPSAGGAVSETSTGSWNGQPFAVSLRGVGLANGTPASRRFLIGTRGVDFGQVEVGALSSPQSIMVLNMGPGSVTMNGTGGAAGVFGGTQNCQGATIGEGEFCEMTYRFAPTTPGETTVTATGTWNGESYSIELRGYGVQRERFLITPLGHDFGSVAVGSSSGEHIVRVRNLGPGAVTMDGTGGAAAEFGGTQNCQGATLSEGASCEMTYRFTPTSAGEVVRTTSGTWNGQPYSLTFRGAGVQRARFLISPVGFDFGEVELGTTAPEQSVTVTNLGPGPVIMSGTGGAAGLFGGVQNCQGVTLAEGGSCTMSYSFTPAEAGPVSTTTNGSWNGQSYELSFSGVGVPPISADMRFGGFLPPFNKRPKLLPGMTLPVKARLLDETGMPLPDAQAAAMAEACEVIILLSATPDSPLCARYQAEERNFQVNLRLPRLIPLGTHRVSMLVRVNDTMITVGEAEFEIPRR